MISACGRCQPVPRFAVGHCVTAAMVNGRGQGGGRWPVVLYSAVPWLLVRGQDREETWSKSQSFPSPKFLNPMGHRPRHAQTGVASNSSALWGNANSSARRFSSTSHKHTTAITGDESTAAVMAPPEEHRCLLRHAQYTYRQSHGIFGADLVSIATQRPLARIDFRRCTPHFDRGSVHSALAAASWPRASALHGKCPTGFHHGRLFQPSGVWQRKGWRMSGYSPQSDRRGQAAMVVHFHTGASSRGEGFSSYPSDSP